MATRTAVEGKGAGGRAGTAAKSPKAARPAKPAKTAGSAEPARAAGSAKTVGSAEPVPAARPAAPAKSARAAKPAKAGRAAKPAKTGRPAKSGKAARPAPPLAAAAGASTPARAPRRSRARSWSARELRLVDRLAEVHAELDAAQRERAGLIAYVLRLHAGSVGAPGPDGWSPVHVDTAAGRLTWRVAPEDADLFQEQEAAVRARGRTRSLPVGTAGDRERSVETLTRLSFLHLHRRPNRPTRTSGGG
ncbi:hypothetical protein [Streptomyces sp. SPB074]|uniref:hypothetical protein n=1 Tax=Streptomyces sp. (strain SPB074) TaxID=465543 RepID=UPI00056C39AD|nr:hypothetical protein [Streptomyces sp. SPB074]